MSQNIDEGPKDPWIKINFDNSLLSGIPHIDEEHKKLYQLAADILRAYLNNPRDKNIEEFLLELRTTLSEHFEHEEVEMAQRGFPEFIEHQESHSTLMTHFLRLHASYTHNLMSFSDLYTFLTKEVIQDHIIKYDLIFHQFLDQKA